MKLIAAIVLLLPVCYSYSCPSHQYWDKELEACLTCTECKEDQVIIQPCQRHKNTECKTFSSLNSFDIFNKKSKNHKTLHFKTADANDDDDDDIYKDIFSKHPESFEKHHKKHVYGSDKLHKNKKHYSFKQRINDKFLDWDDDDDVKTYKKHKKHFEFDSVTEPHHRAPKHHFVDFEDDEDENIIHDSLLSHHDLSKTDNFYHNDKHKENKHKKTVHLDNKEDEDILKQWLIQSKKQLKLKKDDMLKTLKEERGEFDEEDKKVKLNYPLHDTMDFDDEESKNSHSHKEKSSKYVSDEEEQMFKDLIKSDEARDMDLSPLLSNKREPFGYKSPSRSHRLFLGEPSTISEIIDQDKNSHDVLKEEIGHNIIFEKSKFSVVPIPKDIDNSDDDDDEDEKQNDVISVPFTAAERFVWDWQAVALCSAVLTCSIFFMVVAIYSILNARQWKRVKRHYSTEIEEMSTRISLMQPTMDGSIFESPTGYVVEKCPKIPEKH